MRLNIRLILNLGIIVFASLFAVSTTLGQVRTITTTGNWSNPAIWSGGNIAATIAEDVEMDNNTTATVQNAETFNVGDITASNIWRDNSCNRGYIDSW